MYKILCVSIATGQTNISWTPLLYTTIIYPIYPYCYF